MNYSLTELAFVDVEVLKIKIGHSLNYNLAQNYIQNQQTENYI